LTSPSTQSMEDSSIYVKTGPFIQCRVQPLVIFNILDHFTRRSEGESTESRVIGTLLGYNNDGVLEVRNSFPVPHSEGEEQLGVDMQFHKEMLKLHHQIAPKEVILGWYSTGSELNQKSALIHSFYTKEIGAGSNPVHITVDTNLTNFHMSIKGFVNNSVTLQEGKELGYQFLPVPLELESFDEERVAVDALNKGRVSGGHGMITSDLDNLEASVHKVHELLENVSAYVKSVQEGKISGDNNIGRFLMDALSSLPKLDAGALESMFTNSLQDLLLVVYLANLTRTQLALAEKLQKVV